MGQFQYAPQAFYAFLVNKTSIEEYACMTYIYIAGKGFNTTTIWCVHEQNLTGLCIFPVFCLITYIQINN